MLRIRRAERDIAPGAFTLKTIPKIGFRLLPHEDPGATSPSPSAGGERPRRGLGPRVVWPAATLMILLISGVALVTGVRGFTKGAPSATAAGDPASNLAASDLRLRGAAAVFEGTPQQMMQGISYFRAAARQSPNDAAIWGSLAMASVLNQTNLPPSGQRTAEAEIRQASRRALELDPGESHAWAALVSLSPAFGAWTTKADILAKARARATKDGPPVLRQEALFLAAIGRMSEALEKTERLHRLHSMVPFVQAELVRLLTAQGQFEAADAEAAKARQVWPRDHDLWLARFELALAERDIPMAEAIVGDPANWPLQVRAADMARRKQVVRAMASGRSQDADAAIAAYLHASGEGQGYLEEGVWVAAALNRTDAAFRMASELYGKSAPAERFRFTDHVEFAAAGDRRTDIWFGPFSERLWTDPRFLPLMDRIGLVAYWRQQKPPDLCADAAMRAACGRIGIAPSVRVASSS
jgi:tetratricopeptide (TPR) repeat protein